MANVPRFDPNDPESFNSLDPAFRRNRLVTDMFEPGSTFKIVAFSEALESGKITETDMIDCMGGSYRIGRHVVNDSHELGAVTAEDVLVYSSNIGTIKVAERIGKQKLYERARLLGFGEVTGSDFPNETRGILPNPRTWSNLSLPTISFGQGVAVSPLQIVAAYAAIANGGELLSPRIISEFRDRSGNTVRAAEIRSIRRAMTRETAARLTSILCSAVDRGTGRTAAIPGVRLAGKTGTAQRIQEGGGGYGGGKYLSSFIGFNAESDPKLVCLVMIDSPVGAYYGAQVAGPVFKNIMNRIINMGHSPLTPPMAETAFLHGRTAVVPALANTPARAAEARLRVLGFSPRIVGDPTVVVKQFPAEGTVLKRGACVTLYTDSFTSARGDSVAVPDLTGKTLREAVQDLVQANLKVKVVGSGLVEAQTPEPGTLVAYGTVCEIACGKR
jgi:membrane peptidoglycan carboxypeptidase